MPVGLLNHLILWSMEQTIFRHVIWSMMYVCYWVSRMSTVQSLSLMDKHRSLTTKVAGFDRKVGSFSIKKTARTFGNESKIGCMMTSRRGHNIEICIQSHLQRAWFLLVQKVVSLVFYLGLLGVFRQTKWSKSFLGLVEHSLDACCHMMHCRCPFVSLSYSQIQIPP